MTAPAVAHVVDDDEIIREILSALLGAAGYDVRVFGAATDFLAALPTLPSGVLITDVHMPDMTGIELLTRMQDRLAQFPTIVLTGNADVPLAVQALKSGAADFIEKPFEAVAVLKAVQSAAQRVSIAADVVAQRDEYAQRIAALSARERDVLRGLVAGWSNKTIARELDISPRTVESYRATLMTKMHAASLSELVRMALVSEAAL